MENQLQQPKIDITKTTSVNDENGNPILLAEGAILRKGNKFILATDTDPLIPIPVMYDVNTKKICLDMIPKELRQEYENFGFYISK
ncbi:MAG: hypothetical protein AABY22_34340 [Nanoarchaeota archaeon]